MHTLYFVLAAFDLMTVCGGLYLSHRTMSVFEQSVAENRATAERISDLTHLGALATEVNAPGNDIFDSHDAAAERARRDDALVRFDAELKAVRARIPADHFQVRGALDLIDTRMSQMVGESEVIFTLFASGKAEEAGTRMATMDRRYAMVTGAVSQATLHLQARQSGQFSQQLSVAQGWRRYEYLIGILILTMVSCVVLYGHRIGLVMRRGEEERERLMEALAERENLSRARLNDAIENMAEGFALYDRDDKLVMYNHCYAELFNISGADLKPGETFAEITRRELATGRYRGVEDEATWFADRLRRHHEASGETSVELANGRWARLYDRRTAEGGAIVMIFDITERVEDGRRMSYLAHFDQMTGLANRVTFFEAIAACFAEPSADGAPKGVALH